MENHFLEHIFPTSLFTTEEQQTIISYFRKVSFCKNDFLLQMGNTADKYWFVESGYARSYTIDPEGSDITTHFYSAYDITIDWPSFFMKAPTRENIQAITECQCWEIDFNSFQYLFSTIENFRDHGRNTMVQSYFELKNKSIAMIADSATERYLKLIESKPHIIQNVSLKHIATYLGITDTSLSRIRKDLTL